MSETCKGCGAPIRWVKTIKNKPMPADPDEVQIITKGGTLYRGYIVHWATCPVSDKFKSKKPTAGIKSMQWQCSQCGNWNLKAHKTCECGNTMTAEDPTVDEVTGKDTF